MEKNFNGFIENEFSINDLLNMIQEGREEIEYYHDYNKIINTCLLRGLNKSALNFYTEMHHILPKCLGGKNEDNNYVLLKAEEHITAHILLAKMYPDDEKITSAANIICMNNSFRDRNILNEDLLRFLSISRGIFTGSNKKVVICYDLDTFEVFGVFKSMHEADRQIKFGYRSISNCINGRSNSVWGYGFSTYEKFSKEHPTELLKYKGVNYSKISKKAKHIKSKQRFDSLKLKKIVGITDEGNIIAVLKSLFEIEKYNGKASTLKTVLSNKNKYYGKIRWFYYDDIIDDYKEPIDKFINLYGDNYLVSSEFKLYDFGNHVISISKDTGEFIKLYNSIKDASDELDIDESSISKCLKGKQKYTFNYKWISEKDAIKNFPDKYNKLINNI